MRNLLPFRIVGKIVGFAGKVASNFGPKGQIAGAVLGGASSTIGLLTSPPEPLAGKDLTPATYLNMDNGLNIRKAAEVISQLR